MQAAPGTPLTSRGDGAPVGPRRLAVLAGVAGLAWALDVVTKVLAVEHLADRGPVTVVPGVLDLTFGRNSGAAFSLATDFTVVLTVVAMVVVGAIAYVAPRVRSLGWAVALGLLLGGALGNLTDRVFRSPGPLRGHVVDFLQLPHWPVFNLADSAICCAAALIVVLSLRGVAMDGTRAGGPAEARRDDER